MSEPSQVVRIDYTNWRGDTSVRRILPKEIRYQSSEHHPELQWALIAEDLENGEMRAFAMKDIHRWAQEVVLSEEEEKQLYDKVDKVLGDDDDFDEDGYLKCPC